MVGQASKRGSCIRLAHLNCFDALLMTEPSHSGFETGMVLIVCNFMVMFALLMIVVFAVIILASVHVVITSDLHVIWCTTHELELRMQGFFLVRYIRMSDFSLPVWTSQLGETKTCQCSCW